MEAQETVSVVEFGSNPFDDSNRLSKLPEEVTQETPITKVKEEETPVAEVKPTGTTTTTTTPTTDGEDEVVDVDAYFEKEFGKKPDEFKAEYEELKKLREEAQTKQEIKFANEQMEKLFNSLKEGKSDDVYNFLDTQRRLSQATDMKGADAIRLHLQLANPHYTPQDVVDVFEERYTYPNKPEQEVGELDNEYKARVDNWQAQVDKINRRVERDAFNAKQELAKMKTELVLPDIPKANNEQANEAGSNKEVDPAKIEQLRQSYLTALNSDLQKVKGFDVVFKDEEVEIPISHLITDVEKSAYKAKLENFDVDGFVTSRWFNADGSPNVEQLMKDVYLLENEGTVFQKIANEAGSKRLAEYRKKTSNIKVDGEGGSTFNPSSEKDELTKMAEAFFKS